MTREKKQEVFRTFALRSDTANTALAQIVTELDDIGAMPELDAQQQEQIAVFQAAYRRLKLAENALRQDVNHFVVAR